MPGQIRELLLTRLPSAVVVPPFDGSQPLNAHQHRLSPLACPCYCLLVLFSLACILVLSPHSWSPPPRWPGALACLLSGSPRCETAVTQPHAPWKVLHHSYTFFPLIIIIIIVLRASPKRRFIRRHKCVRCCPWLDIFAVLRKYSKFHWHLHEIFLSTGWLKWVTQDRAKPFATLTIEIYFYSSGLLTFLLNAYYLNKLIWAVPIFSVTSVNCLASLRGQRQPWKDIWRK